MAAPTIYEGLAEDVQLDHVGQLFAGLKFWVAQRVPFRNRLLDDIKSNGGEVVLLEKKADYLIADHFRPGCPPGSISYDFINKSLKDGQLRDPEDHRAGPPLGEARQPGALNRPAKGGRAAYTAEEDNILYKWVRDCESNGGLVSGNEIYKQLEAKYPRHTWQSWRDRYLKQLRDRPPSAFNIPDNAPPSPPSDTSAGQQRPPQPTVQAPKGATTKQPLTQAATKTANSNKAEETEQPREDYTLAQLEATFTSQDWEELYAFVDVIDSPTGDDYIGAWKAFADAQENQTAEQWRQYYEKVVRPQWLRDPESKRRQIKQKVEQRHENESMEPSQVELSQQEANTEEKHVSGAVAESDAQEDTILESEPEPKLESSATVQYESPHYISSLFPNTLKRLRGDTTPKSTPDSENLTRPWKRQRSATPVNDDKMGPLQGPIGTHQDPLEISSTSTSQSDILATQIDEQVRRKHERGFDEHEASSHDDEANEDFETIERAELPTLSSLDQPYVQAEDISDEDLPSNTPTPRASRQKRSNFDTQAILSSPSQEFQITKLPRPLGYTQDSQVIAEHRSSSLTPHIESDASTTLSMQDFRQSLTGEEPQSSYPALQPLPRLASSSPAPSDISSAGSGDPDMPLEADEIEDFFDKRLEEGHNHEFIVRALKRTRLRPDLAGLVLEAWREGQPLPNQRGIWSIEDDEAVESGDGITLAKLEKKHTLDGWGGVTERLRFLEGYRNR